ncbi:hypothetical protein BDU57DRAFT_431186, partial [Ampelomyces quisqualis]
EERDEEGELQWKEAGLNCGQDIGEFTDTELFAAAVVSGHAITKFRSEGSVVHKAQTFPSCRAILETLE